MAIAAISQQAYLGSALYKYLCERFAHTVVLTFAEIEDLLGFDLPDAARRQRDWWTGSADRGEPQARLWTDANRTAVPNLVAGSVVFERVGDSH
jgi:hypothetical protein